MEDILKYRGLSIEIRALWSNEKSYFSLKRIERSIMFVTALILQAWYIVGNMFNLSASELLMLTGSLFFFAGYSMKATEKEKANETK